MKKGTGPFSSSESGSGSHGKIRLSPLSGFCMNYRHLTVAVSYSASFACPASSLP